MLHFCFNGVAPRTGTINIMDKFQPGNVVRLQSWIDGETNGLIGPQLMVLSKTSKRSSVGGNFYNCIWIETGRVAEIEENLLSIDYDWLNA
jgi:hypothetical protein